MDTDQNLATEPQSHREPTRKAGATDPAALPEDVRRKLIQIRNALVGDNPLNAYHHLYEIADPHFECLDPWAKLEGRANHSTTDGHR